MINRPKKIRRISQVRVHVVVGIAALLILFGVNVSIQQPLLAEVLDAPSTQSTQGIFAVAGAQGADLYDAPDGTVLESLLPGATLTAVGRTAESLWIVVETAEGMTGWVEESAIVIFGEESVANYRRNY